MKIDWTNHPMAGGETIEAAFIPSRTTRPQGYFVLWPCMGGDCRMYGMPVEAFTEKGWDVLLYNPRGHGNSTGYLSVATAAEDLKALLGHYALSGVPLTAFGHSGGCAALLKAAVSGIHVERFFFAAPVLDSRRSLFYMYDQGTIGEFILVTSRLADDPEFYKKTLQNTKWLDTAFWHKQDLERLLNGANGAFPVGSFLKELFIPGIDAMPEFLLRETDVTLFFPEKDNWYPHRETVDASSDRVAAVVVEAAQDHYFSCGWGAVWEGILTEVATHGLQ